MLVNFGSRTFRYQEANNQRSSQESIQSMSMEEVRANLAELPFCDCSESDELEEVIVGLSGRENEGTCIYSLDHSSFHFRNLVVALEVLICRFLQPRKGLRFLQPYQLPWQVGCHCKALMNNLIFLVVQVQHIKLAPLEDQANLQAALSEVMNKNTTVISRSLSFYPVAMIKC